MPDAVLIFTFSPVQPFIAEARRAADLFVASNIIVKLARAAAKVIKNYGSLVYPSAPDGDVPNKIVALAPWEKIKAVAKEGEKGLLCEWEQITNTAKNEIKGRGPVPDKLWQEIWERQTSHLWEIYWSAASLANRTYAEAYKEADRALAGVKRTRIFEAAEEQGLKDSLSGRREALHTKERGARAYWKEIGQHVGAAKLRPNGRERLDALGATKRFCELAAKSFPSTSTIASTDFLIKARDYLSDYRQAIENLLGNHLYSVRKDDKWPYDKWPYDGDLLFMETLSQNRLEDSYGIRPQELMEESIRKARQELGQVYKKLNAVPSPYYSLIVLDGDSMGERIDGCLKEEDPKEAHRNLSERLLEFSKSIGQPVEEKYTGYLIYNGGDDVMVLAPLSQTLNSVHFLSKEFKKITGGTASAGVAVAHHLYPLDAVLRAARAAEQKAKKVTDKAAVCVRVMKRSGEKFDVCSPWKAMGDNFDRLVMFFKENMLPSRFAYEAMEQSQVVNPLEDSKIRNAVLKRLVKRHKTNKLAEPDQLVNQLDQWAADLDEYLPKEEQNGCKIPQGFVELSRWLVLARFVAQGGSE